MEMQRKACNLIIIHVGDQDQSGLKHVTIFRNDNGGLFV